MNDIVSVYYELPAGNQLLLLKADGCFYNFDDDGFTDTTDRKIFFTGDIVQVGYIPKRFVNGTRFWFLKASDKTYTLERCYNFNPCRAIPRFRIGDEISFRYEESVFVNR